MYKQSTGPMNREAFILFGLLMGGDYDNKVTLSDF
jgi:hypothetical protein